MKKLLGLAIVIVLIVVGAMRWAGGQEGAAIENVGEAASERIPTEIKGTQSPVEVEAATATAAPIKTSARRTIAPTEQSVVFTGTVVNEAGEPVPEFQIVAQYRAKPKGSEWEDRDLGTFQGGVFELSNLAEGRWRIEATATDYRNESRESFRVPGKSEEFAFVLTREALIHGIVLDPNGRAAPNAKILRKTTLGQGDVTSDTAGRFEMRVLPGNVSIAAQHDLYAASTKKTVLAELGPPKEVVLNLRIGAKLTGEALDKKNAPLSNWWVKLNTTEWGQDRRKVQVDEAGRFVFEHVAPGTYWAEAVKSEDRSSGPKPIRDSVELLDGKTTHLVLGGLNENAVVLTGTAYKDGAPAPGMRLWGNLEGAESFSSGSTVLADELGRFELEFPGSGQATILVSPIANKIVPMSIELADKREQELDIYIPSGVISGRVIHSDPDQKKRRLVQLKSEGNNPLHGLYLGRQVRTDKEGNFRIEYMPAGYYRIELSKVKHPSSMIEGIRLEPDGIVEDLVLEFGETGKADILVVDENNQPVSGALVYAQAEGGMTYDPGLNARTDVDGIESFTRLGLGEFRFFARKGELTSVVSEACIIKSDETAKVTLQLIAGAHGSIQVLDGVTPVTARLWVVDSKGRDFSRTMSTFDHPRYLLEGYNTSRYKVGPIPAGTYSVRAQVLDGREANGTLEMTVKGEAELVLRLGS